MFTVQNHKISETHREPSRLKDQSIASKKKTGNSSNDDIANNTTPRTKQSRKKVAGTFLWQLIVFLWPGLGFREQPSYRHVCKKLECHLPLCSTPAGADTGVVGHY